jgi:hypothetical protein
LPVSQQASRGPLGSVHSPTFCSPRHTLPCARSRRTSPKPQVVEFRRRSESQDKEARTAQRVASSRATLARARECRETGARTRACDRNDTDRGSRARPQEFDVDCCECLSHRPSAFPQKSAVVQIPMFGAVFYSATLRCEPVSAGADALALRAESERQRRAKTSSRLRGVVWARVLSWRRAKSLWNRHCTILVSSPTRRCSAHLRCCRSEGLGLGSQGEPAALLSGQRPAQRPNLPKGETRRNDQATTARASRMPRARHHRWRAKINANGSSCGTQTSTRAEINCVAPCLPRVVDAGSAASSRTVIPRDEVA